MKSTGIVTSLLFLVLLVAACGDSSSYLDGMSTPRFALEKEVNGCQVMHDTAFEGYDIGRYRPGSKAVLLAGINAAKAVAATAGASDDQLKSALDALYQVKDTFIANRHDMYTSLVEKSYNDLNTAVERLVPEEKEYPVGATNEFKPVWLAQHIAVTNKTEPMENRIAAWQTLRAAYMKFKAVQKFTAVKVSMVCVNPSMFDLDKKLFIADPVPGIPDGTYRFFEFFNNSDEDIDIGSWSIQTFKYKNLSVAGAYVKKINFNTYGDSLVIKARSYLLVSRDDIWAAGVQPDFIVPDMEMYTGDGERGIAVVKVNDNDATNFSPLIVDAVGYTNYQSTSVTAGYYESNILTNTRLFVRKWDSTDSRYLQDTDNNRNDFINISVETNRWRLPRNSQYTGTCAW